MLSQLSLLFLVELLLFACFLHPISAQTCSGGCGGGDNAPDNEFYEYAATANYVVYKGCTGSPCVTTWFGARNFCVRRGTTLASIHSSSQQNEAKNAFPSSQRGWVGLRGGSSTWEDGTGITYTNYDSGSSSDNSKSMVIDQDTRKWKFFNNNGPTQEYFICNRGPTSAPTTSQPSKSPSMNPTKAPTSAPTRTPSSSPSTSSPSKSPSISPTANPSISPTHSPSRNPSASPTRFPSTQPTISPTKFPSSTPTKVPSRGPSVSPTNVPSSTPSQTPTKTPTNSPTDYPTSSSPSITPTRQPSGNPTSVPTRTPTAVSVITVPQANRAETAQPVPVLVIALVATAVVMLLVLSCVGYLVLRSRENQLDKMQRELAAKSQVSLGRLTSASEVADEEVVSIEMR